MTSNWVLYNCSPVSSFVSIVHSQCRSHNYFSKHNSHIFALKFLWLSIVLWIKTQKLYVAYNKPTWSDFRVLFWLDLLPFLCHCSLSSNHSRLLWIPHILKSYFDHHDFPLINLFILLHQTLHLWVFK